MPFTQVTLFFISYAFEIVGRRTTLFLSFFLTSILFYLMPRTAPSYAWLLVVRCGIAVTMVAPLCHPLVADYIQKGSRGRAIALSAMGTVLGEILAIGIFKVNQAFKMDFTESFTLTAILIATFSFFYLFTIVDPNLD